MNREIRVFYDPAQMVAQNDSMSPSAGKPGPVVESWKNLGLPFTLSSFRPLQPEEIALAHDPDYVRGVLSCQRVNGFGNGSPAIARALPWVCGSAVAAALSALKEGGITFSPTSGAHHAGFSEGGGFCTFNFLVVAALLARKAGAKRVGILDLDMHYGNGTEEIRSKLGLKFLQHYSFGELNLRAGREAENWLKELPSIVRRFRAMDLVLYNAGVDSHMDDPLGGVLTTAQLRERDRTVLEILANAGTPVCVSLAGGYQVDARGSIDAILRLHDATFEEAVRALRQSRDPL